MVTAGYIATFATSGLGKSRGWFLEWCHPPFVDGCNLLKKVALIALAVLWAMPAHAYLVRAVLDGGGFGGGFSATVEYETTTNQVTFLSLTTDQPLGLYLDGGVFHPNIINGPLDIASSSIVISNTASVDSYDFVINIDNGPLVRANQSGNNQLLTAQLVQVRLNSAQNTNPISSDTLDENLFDAFVPHSGVQPQRLFLEYEGRTAFPYNRPDDIGSFTPTSTSVVATPSPAPLALLAGGAVVLGVGLGQRRT